jgi:hypothetical protein
MGLLMSTLPVVCAWKPLAPPVEYDGKYEQYCSSCFGAGFACPTKQATASGGGNLTFSLVITCLVYIKIESFFLLVSIFCFSLIGVHKTPFEKAT